MRGYKHSRSVPQAETNGKIINLFWVVAKCRKVHPAEMRKCKKLPSVNIW